MLAFLVMFSTVSFTVEKHFCGDVLIDISVFSEREGCGMEVIETLQEKSCCKDEVNVIEGQDELKITSFEDLTFEKQQLLKSFVFSFAKSFENLLKDINSYKDYSPPNLVYDIQVLDQIFLI